MATGTIIKLFKHKKDQPEIDSKIYDKYIESCKRAADSLSFNGQAAKIIYSKYKSICRDEIGYSNCITVYNRLDDLEKKPEPSDLSIVELVGETGFNSMHNILVEIWDMNAYNGFKQQHVFTDVEISEFLAMANYIDSDAFYSKSMERYEEQVFGQNMFFKAIMDELPSRTFPKDFAKGDMELKEQEDSTRYFCRTIGTFMKFYNIVNEDAEFDKCYYKLVYYKW